MRFFLSTRYYCYIDIALDFWSFKSTRLWITLIFCLTVTSNALIRNTISMAMVCMVSTNSTSGKTQSEENSSCSSASENQKTYQGTFEWDTFQQGLLFSALNIGGLISALPAGWMADRYDPKTLVTVSMILMTLGSLLSPVTASHGGFAGFFTLRLIMGLFGQAVVFSGISSISARWIPPTERSTVIAIYTSGNQLCSVIGSPLNALLCSSTNFLDGWPSIFYVNALFGIVATIMWMIFVSNRPESNRFISQSEKLYIEDRLASQNLGKRKDVTRKVPWLKMITSLAVLQVLLCNFSAGVMGTALQTYIPTYFKDVFYVNLLSNGLLSALPYIVQSVSKVFFAIIADYMKRKTNISPTWICKMFNSLSHFGAAIFLIACSFMNCSSIASAVVLLCFANGSLSANSAGFLTSAVSVAPPFSGMVMSISRLAGQVGSVVAPYLVSAITANGETQSEWQTVFFVISGLMVFAGVLFLIFGSAAIQEWAKTKPNLSLEKAEAQKMEFNSSIIIKDSKDLVIEDFDKDQIHENNSMKF